MAATLITLLPLLIIYMFVQKKFMEGVERSGLTGM
jgi:ABC-type glycerol-3-phosphate transport system permease component